MKKCSLKDLMKKRKKKGFTLVELIIVIAIIAVLVAIAVPKFGQVSKDSKIKADIATAKNIHSVATRLYAEGKIEAGGSNIDSEVAKDIDDGSSTLPKTKVTNTAFHVAIDKSGNIKVSAGTDEVYPQQTKKFGGTK